MIAQIVIENSFGEAKQFNKEYEVGDFKKFLNDEGEYIDKLAGILKEKGKNKDAFCIVYTVTLSR